MNISLTGSIEEILLAHEKWKEKKQVNLKKISLRNAIQKLTSKNKRQEMARTSLSLCLFFFPT